jgi:hypothetical protein
MFAELANEVNRPVRSVAGKLFVICLPVSASQFESRQLIPANGALPVYGAHSIARGRFVGKGASYQVCSKQQAGALLILEPVSAADILPGRGRQRRGFLLNRSLKARSPICCRDRGPEK